MMALLLNCRINPKLVNFLLLILLLHSTCSRCENESDSENYRDKRTIGVLFRSFVDVLQPQKQQAPMVYSYRPQKQTSPQQSTKADLLASSKNLLQQKKNLFKSSSAQPPDTEVIRPTVTPTTTNTPSTEPVPQVAPNNQAQVQPPPNPLPTAPLNPFPNLIPPSGHHPLTPLKAQILIIPFQGQHDPTAAFSSLGSVPRPPSGISPFNYQAEIYLHPPGGGIYPPVNQYPTQYQYSPANGWHDIDEILSSGVQMIRKDSKNAGVVDLTNSGEVASDSQANSETPAPSVPTTSVPEPKSDGSHQNDVEGHRRDSLNQNYYDEQRDYLTHSLLLPNFHQDPLLDAAHFGNFHFQERTPLFPHFPLENYKQSYYPLEVPKVQNNDQYSLSVESHQQSQGNGEALTPPHDGPGNVQFVHDFIPQRQLDLKDNRQTQQYEQEGNNQNNIYYQQQDSYHPYQQEQLPQHNYIIHHQYPTKIGRLPDPYEYQNQHQSTAQNQQKSPIYNNEYIAQNPNTTYRKRSNTN